MYCPKCNTPNPAFNKTCRQCDEKLPIDPPIKDIDLVNSYLSGITKQELEYSPANIFEKTITNFMYSNYLLNRRLGSSIWFALSQAKGGISLSISIIASILTLAFFNQLNLEFSKPTILVFTLFPGSVLFIYLSVFTYIDAYCVKLEKAGRKISWLHIFIEIAIVVAYMVFLIGFKAGYRA